jgi:hypothetical protein
VHHAAGGYPKIMNAEGIAAMMGDFLAAFPDLLITFDQFIAKDDFVVERYTASGTHQGPLGDLQPTNRTATWTGINIFRIGCGRIVEVWSGLMPKAAGGSNPFHNGSGVSRLKLSLSSAPAFCPGLIAAGSG